MAEKWQPIETAPKDGTDILVYVGPHQFAAWYHTDTESGCSMWAISTDRCNEAISFSTFLPTHWMPLPKPPK